MNRLPCVLLAGIILLAGGAGRADEDPARTLGGWVPPKDLLEAAAVLGADNAEARQTAIHRVDALPAAERVRLLRAGLRLPDGAAAKACAARLLWTEVDDAESARIVELGLLDALQPGSEFDFEQVRSMLGSTELAPLLDRMAAAPPVAATESVLGHVHRQVRADHVPALCRLALSEHEVVARGGLDNLRIAVGYTDRFREDVARTLVMLGPWPTRVVTQRDPDAPARAPPSSPGKSGGWPAPLVAAIESLWLAEERLPCIYWEFDRWALRWMQEATPAPQDLGLMTRLVDLALAAGEEHLLRACAEALGGMSDDGSAGLLTRIADTQGTPGPGVWTAYASLARRGDAIARGRLLGGANDPEPGLPLALAASVDPVLGGALLRERLASGDPEETSRLLELLDDSLQSRGELWCGPVIPDSALAGLEERVLESELEGLPLARLGSSVPTCRTKRVAAAALARLAKPPTDDALEVWGVEDFLRVDLPFLEVADAAGLRAVLRGWASSDEGAATKAQEVALLALLQLGDPKSGARLVEWVESGGAENLVEAATVMLARSAGPDVKRFVEQRMATAPGPLIWATKAALGGVPESVALDLFANFDESSLTPEKRHEQLTWMREGRVIDVILDRCFEGDDVAWTYVGLVRDQRIVEALRRVRDARERGLYLWATSQLVLAGDAEATEDLDRAFRTGRYRWIDNAHPRVLTLGGRMSRVPDWFDDLESNCCRFNPVAGIFSGTPDVALVDMNEGSVSSTRWTPAAIVRRIWEARGGERQPYSRLAGLHVPVVR